MMQISKILQHDRLTLALTGLQPKEFKNLLPTFIESWNDLKLKDYRKHRKERTRKPGGGRKGYLKEMQDKLFFILFYFKCYPTYDVTSLLWGFDRANACKNQQRLTGTLEKTLGKKMALPERRLKKLEDFFEMFPEAREVFVDGTERPIQRPKDKKAQKDKYSGKKKRHTVKNIIISTKKKRIGFLSETVNGKEHDFAILKEHAPPKYISKGIKQHMDMGFTGYHDQFPNHKISIPERKPRTKDLCQTKINQNKKKSSIRILVEHAIGGVKRLRIVTDVFRNKVEGASDKAMYISCGLWNYHLSMS